MIDIRNSEKGNVLFLILIAVALFAALSYAVTQSTRSGGGDTKRETSLISGAQITQYPASIKTAIIRMSISKGVTDSNLWFNIPSGGNYTGNVASGDIGSTYNQDNFVFHASGGGATYQKAPEGVLLGGNNSRDWYFNANFNVQDVGTSQAEVVAYLPYIEQNVCSSINEQLGLGSDIPDDTTVDIADIVQNRGVTDDGAAKDSIDDAVSSAGGSITDPPAGGTIGTGLSIAGNSFGCFRATAGDDVYVYYHVLVER